MKINISFPCGTVLLLGAALLNQPAQAQLTLVGTNYTQNFDSISNGLSAGWSVRIDATATNLGTITTNFNASGKTWGDRTGEFGNCASIMGNSGTNFTGGESTTTQGNCTNRALAVRQTGSFGDPGAAFVLQIANTAGLSNLTFNVDLDMLRVNPYATTWTIQYAVGDAPSSFSTLGDYPDPGMFGATTLTYNLGADADNSTENVWIRIVALSSAVGSGSRDTLGIDNFSLSWDGNSAAVTMPSITGITLANGDAQINFTGDAGDTPSSFTLQSADQVSDAFSDTDATITQTAPGNFQAVCPQDGSQQFYRVERP
jgi:hypothetical protein